MESLSAIIKALTPVDRTCYLNIKLTLTSGTQLPDPYSLPEREWSFRHAQMAKFAMARYIHVPYQHT